jgi:cell division protein ZapE
MTSLLTKYKEKLSAQGWHADAEQLAAVEELQRLAQDLQPSKSFWLFSKKKEIEGIYLHGGVGRGKSMLMDLFFNYVPNTLQKRRVHFHEFMIETHDWLHANRGSDMADLLPAYARHVSGNVNLLCFDEFHVTDVADAMILGRLFTALIDQGVIVVSTSNWAPDHLYEGGLQRELFLPFIALLKERLNAVHLDSDTDYRQLSDPDQDVYYFYPLNAETKQKIDLLFAELTNNKKIESKIIEVKSRGLKIKSVKDIARMTFAQLCEQPLGAEDYIEIAKAFDTIFVENVPCLTAGKRNEAKRLILLIDCLYEGKCRLIVSAECDVHHLYDGDDHAFEFDRTISRLMEMQSYAYHEERMSL